MFAFIAIVVINKFRPLPHHSSPSEFLEDYVGDGGQGECPEPRSAQADADGKRPGNSAQATIHIYVFLKNLFFVK